MTDRKHTHWPPNRLFLKIRALFLTSRNLSSRAMHVSTTSSVSAFIHLSAEAEPKVFFGSTSEESHRSQQEDTSTRKPGPSVAIKGEPYRKRQSADSTRGLATVPNRTIAPRVRLTTSLALLDLLLVPPQSASSSPMPVRVCLAKQNTRPCAPAAVVFFYWSALGQERWAPVSSQKLQSIKHARSAR